MLLLCVWHTTYNRIPRGQIRAGGGFNLMNLKGSDEPPTRRLPG
jgi:hypothetical protein